MAKPYRDPTDPDAARQALVDQLGPDQPQQLPDQPSFPGAPGAEAAPRVGTSAVRAPLDPVGRTPLDPSAGPNPVDPGTPAPPPADTAPPRSGTLPVPTPPSPDLGVQYPPNEGAPRPLVPPIPSPSTGGRPTGGNLTDPGYVDRLIAWAAQQPGVNPSVIRDPNYWRQAVSRFNGDENYFMQRMMTPEGPPEGALSGSNLTAAGGFGLNPQNGAFNQQLRAFMLSQLGQLSQPTDENSPEIAPALSAFRNQSARDEQSMRDRLAERFYAQGEGGTGLQSGGFNTAVQQGQEAAAGNRANFAGTTVYNAAQAKRQRLQELLQTASSAGLTDQAQAIQMQIAQIDADLRRQGLSQQDRQFNDQLGFSYSDLRARMNRDAILAGMNG